VKSIDRETAERVIAISQLSGYAPGNDLASLAHGLLFQQQDSWELLRKGYASLASVRTRSFQIGTSEVKVQFNPGRITSSAAKVDAKSIQERPCFLCVQNLPPEQLGILYDGEYLVLANPFPIFPEHFTIAHVQHQPQQIAHSFPVLLGLSRELAERYAVLYNGPKCGASAPDHLHFQAGVRGFLPIEAEYEELKATSGRVITQTDRLLVFSAGEFSRPFVAFESPEEETLVSAFLRFYSAFQSLTASSEEPMMNILAYYDDGKWRVLVFPRAKHRPSFFFEEGEKKILISPAAVDLGGICTTPVERDFERVTAAPLEQMFAEVLLPPERFHLLESEFAAAAADGI